MLTALRIRNLAIVEELEVNLGEGLTVITGETGAGKSILIRALKLVLGARARPDMVRTGTERAEIEALFDVSDNPIARERLRGLELPDDNELVIRRVIQAGRSRGSVNGRLTTAAQLRALATGLVDISSQHAHQTLVDPATHLETLDAWANEPGLIEAVEATYRKAMETRATLLDLRRRLEERDERQDLLRFQLSEISRLNPRSGELEEIEIEVARRQHSELLRSATAGAERALYTREGAVCTELRQLEDRLIDTAQHDPSLSSIAEQLTTARTELEDAAEQLGRYAREVNSDPGELARLEERWQELRRLARRFGGDLDAAVIRRQEIEEELAILEQADDQLEELERDAARTEAAAGEAAEALSRVRRAAAEALGDAIGAELADLGMGSAYVKMAVSTLEGAGELNRGEARLTARGMDRAELLIGPNPGEEPRPLRLIASGGELSRALLATKRVLAGLGPVGTYVFDEVDSGVGGAVAEAIGLKLREVARHHQVLCITHQPQIAALGDAHLRVEKRVRAGRTHSKMVPITDEARIEELARMLGGRTVSNAARDAARALLP